MQVEKMEYRGWRNAYRISNRTVELIVTADVGPRIVAYGFRGENEFCELAEELGKTAGTDQRLYGGHRLWLAPEGDETFFPDNNPVEVDISTEHARFTAPIENRRDGIRLQKEIEVDLDASGSHVRVIHRVRNCGVISFSGSAWAITMLREGGRAIAPLSLGREVDQAGCHPHCSIALWPGTNLTDPRLHLASGHIELIAQGTLRGTSGTQKIGVHNPDGWVAYTRADHVFIKRATWKPEAPYTDLNSNIELYVQPGFIELETLGSCTVLGSGDQSIHVEDWALFKSVPEYGDESWVATILVPLLEAR
jgi:hypothetical protein